MRPHICKRLGGDPSCEVCGTPMPLPVPDADNCARILSAVVDAVRVIASDLAQLHTDREILSELYQAGSDMEQAKLFLGNHRNYVSDLEKQNESLQREGTRLLTLCREKDEEIAARDKRIGEYEEAIAEWRAARDAPGVRYTRMGAPTDKADRLIYAEGWLVALDDRRNRAALARGTEGEATTITTTAYRGGSIPRAPEGGE